MGEKSTIRILSQELKKKFGQKVIKLSVNGGFTCPNRDGILGNKGCVFCSESGSGEFAGNPEKSMEEQIEGQIKLLNKKWKTNKYIVYFGAFTNTYAPVETLKKKYYEALSYPGVVGIAIATRADCLSDEILELLSEINNKYFLWIEIGLQTIHKKSSDFIRRGYELELFEERFRRLEELKIKTVVHLIIGLPEENRKDILETINYISNIKPWGVKLHLLHIIKNTDLANYFFDKGFKVFEREEYVNLICDCIERLDEDIVIHRMTGDGRKNDLIEPLWSLDKLRVISEINNELRRRGSFQGSRIE
jgi:radical SAM protein (TIGR01212 family)